MAARNTTSLRAKYSAGRVVGIFRMAGSHRQQAVSRASRNAPFSGSGARRRGMRQIRIVKTYHGKTRSLRVRAVSRQPRWPRGSRRGGRWR